MERKQYAWCQCGALVIGKHKCDKCGSEPKAFNVEIELLRLKAENKRIREALSYILEGVKWIVLWSQL